MAFPVHLGTRARACVFCGFNKASNEKPAPLPLSSPVLRRLSGRVLPDGAHSSSPLILEVRAGVRWVLLPLWTLLWWVRLRVSAAQQLASRSSLDFRRSAGRPGGAERSDQQQVGGVCAQVT